MFTIQGEGSTTVYPCKAVLQENVSQLIKAEENALEVGYDEELMIFGVSYEDIRNAYNQDLYGFYTYIYSYFAKNTGKAYAYLAYTGELCEVNRGATSGTDGNVYAYRTFSS